MPTIALLALLTGCAEAVLATPSAPPTTPLSITGPPVPRVAPHPEELGRVSIVAGGDVIPHGIIKDVAARSDQKDSGGASTNHDGWDALFTDVRPALSAADLAFINLETPVAPDHHKTLATKIFDAPPALLDALVASGVDIVSFANNHVYDQGRTGFVETMDRLSRTPLVQLGAGATCAQAAAPRMVQKNGLTLAFIGSTRLHNAHLNAGPDEPCSFVLDAAVVAKQAAAARAAGADAVILSVHWGVEYEAAPRGWDVTLAHQLLDSGVDVILGHHPHVLQPVEVYEAKDGRTTFVAYSLGNFISGQGLGYRWGIQPLDAGNTRDGALLRFEFVKTRGLDGVARTELANLSVEPTWTEPGTRSCMSVPGVSATLRPVLDSEAARSARAAAETETDPAQKDALERCAAMYDARREHAGQTLGASWLLGGDAAAKALAGVGG